MGIEYDVDYSLHKLEFKPQNDKRFLPYVFNYCLDKELKATQMATTNFIAVHNYDHIRRPI